MRVTQVQEDGTRFEGRVDGATGARQGRGTLYFPDGSFVANVFVDDEPIGPGCYTSAEGTRLEATWVDGAPNGPGRELDEEGTLLFQGVYRDGLRHGAGMLYTDGGGLLLGSWENNELQGQACYVFHGGEGRVCRFGGALVGEWRDGEMYRAHYVEGSPDAAASSLGLPIEEFASVAHKMQDSIPRRDPRSTSFTSDISTSEVISSSPLVSDPYEERRVYVAPSRIPNSGEGLFAKIKLSKGEVAAFYNGTRLTHEVVDGRDWSLNDNTISLNAEEVIDVPPELSSVHSYRASLGHKANHAPNHNAAYAPIWHPRFGSIKCVRVLQDLEAGDEITVNYGYDGEHGYPSWWTIAC